MTEPRKPSLVKAKKRPVSIQSTQWYREWDIALSPETGYIDYSELVDGYNFARQQAVIYTLEGPMHGNSGDWIIIGVKGERYFCKPDIFQATYEFEGKHAHVVDRTSRTVPNTDNGNIDGA